MQKNEFTWHHFVLPDLCNSCEKKENEINATAFVSFSFYFHNAQRYSANLNLCCLRKHSCAGKYLCWLCLQGCYKLCRYWGFLKWVDLTVSREFRQVGKKKGDWMWKVIDHIVRRTGTQRMVVQTRKRRMSAVSLQHQLAWYNFVLWLAAVRQTKFCRWKKKRQ